MNFSNKVNNFFSFVVSFLIFRTGSKEFSKEPASFRNSSICGWHRSWLFLNTSKLQKWHIFFNVSFPCQVSEEGNLCQGFCLAERIIPLSFEKISFKLQTKKKKRMILPATVNSVADAAAFNRTKVNIYRTITK